MSLYQASLMGATNASVRRREVPEEFAAEYPSIAEVLNGVFVPDNQAESVPPATIMLFAEEGRLKFCISPKTGPRIAFGCITDPAKGLGGLEDEIVLGRFEWKLGRRASR
jgi:hypothetical protein